MIVIGATHREFQYLFNKISFVTVKVIKIKQFNTQSKNIL